MKIRLPSCSCASPLRTQYRSTTFLAISSRHLLTSSTRRVEGNGPAQQPKAERPKYIAFRDIPSYTADIDDFTAKYAPNSRSASTLRRIPTPHFLHIYSHRRNTHITLTRPDHNPLISASTGTLGFRKSQRGTYDAAFQLGKYVTERIQHQGLMREIKRLAIVWRDFGKGREALVKVLLGSEGRGLRSRVVTVSDATRVKFGGTKGKKPRRLG